MAVDLWKYSEVLAEQLRLNGMKEEQVREVVAEVQHHVIATQQDPVEAFGQPTDYAMTWIRPRSRRWMMRIMAATAGVTSVVALANGLGPGPWSGPVDIDWSFAILWLTWVVCMGVLPWTVEVWLAVMSREVGQSGHWWLTSDGGVDTVVIVEVEPVGQGRVALVG